MGGMIAVHPKKPDCPHVQQLLASFEGMKTDMPVRCTACQNVDKNWLCLKCSEVFCSRYFNDHMAEHNTQEPSHMITLSFSDWRFWCYVCLSYIESPQLEPIYKDAAKYVASSLKEIKKSTPSGTPALRKCHKDLKSFQLKSSLPKDVLLSHMRAVIYGNCIGDAIGLLTEFMTKEEAKRIYGSAKKNKHTTSKETIEYPQLEYSMKCNDGHRRRWEVGDWTDDSDQMILILRTLLDNNGKADILDFVKRFKVWTKTGFKELGDYGGMGIGHTTHLVTSQKDFSKDPHKCAQQVWFDSGKRAAPNGGVMRTSVLGIQDFSRIRTVIENTRQICKVTHADPRCIASCVAVTTAIALMLQGKYCKKDGTEYDVKKLCKKAYNYACEELQTSKEKEELHRHMFAESLAELELSDESKIGYTYKCLGAGFWAFRQEDFRRALTQVVMEAGDADTNGAVAGALLGCKLGVEKLPASWLDGLKHKQWLDKQIVRYFSMLGFIP